MISSAVINFHRKHHNTSEFKGSCRELADIILPVLQQSNKRSANRELQSRLGVIHKLCYAFFSIFDHLPTYGYVLAIILLIIYLIKICDSYILLTTHLPRRHNVIYERPLSPAQYCSVLLNPFQSCIVLLSPNAAFSERFIRCC